MSESIGYVLSALVAGVILLIIHSTTFRGQEAAVSTLQYNAVKQSTVDMVSMMERDFRNIGSNFPYPDRLSELAVLGYDTASTIQTFTFSAQTVRGALPDTVTYRWSPDKTITTEHGTYSTITVERRVNGELKGMNSGSITALSIELFDADGQPVMAASATRQVKVDLKMISSYGSNGEIKEARWSETFHPMHMAKQDGIVLE